jgi:hypothetical protein
MQILYSSKFADLLAIYVVLLLTPMVRIRILVCKLTNNKLEYYRYYSQKCIKVFNDILQRTAGS